jgi:hypothetical protein
MPEETDAPLTPEDRPDAHLADLPDGCGCTEVWEHTSSGAERPEATGAANGETASSADATE